MREIADVHVVTSPFAESLTWMGERNLWLKDHFGFKESEVTHSDKKFMIVGDMLVDDKPAHCEAWQKARGRHGQALLWHQPHNAPAKTSVTRAYGWDNLLAYVKLRAALLS